MRARRTIVGLLLASLAVVGCDRTAADYDAEERGDSALKRARAKRSVPSEAVQAYREILDRNPRMGSAHLDLALILHDGMKDYVGAIYHYRRYLELRPDAQKAAMIEARIQEATRRFAGHSQGTERSAGTKGTGVSVDTARLLEENASLKIEVARLTQELESLRTSEGPQTVSGEQTPVKPVSTTLVVRTQVPAPSARIRTHKVRPKETLLGIAETVYGDRNQWKKILEANGSLLKGDPKRLREGMELVMP